MRKKKKKESDRKLSQMLFKLEKLMGRHAIAMNRTALWSFWANMCIGEVKLDMRMERCKQVELAATLARLDNVVQKCSQKDLEENRNPSYSCF